MDEMQITFVCSRCRKSAPEVRKASGTKRYCNLCHAADVREYKKQHPEKFVCSKCGKSNPEVRRASRKTICNKCHAVHIREWCRAHPDLVAKHKRETMERLKSDPEKYERFRSKQAKNSYKHDLKGYGLTPEDFDRMLIEQCGCCAICADPMLSYKNSRTRPCVDHDHNTGKVRALVCLGCNLMLGYAQEREHALIAGAQYLRRFK